MTARFNVCIVRYPGEISCFEAYRETAETVYHGLRRLDHDTLLTDDTILPDRVNIVLGYHMLDPDIVARLPDSTIAYNLEQVATGEGDIWLPAMAALKSRFTLWDYNARNCAELRRWGARRVVHVPVGYMPELTRIAPAPELDIDVLFYGLLNEPRKRVLGELQAAGLRVKALVGIYGSERDRYVARAKVVLNMHLYATRVFEIVRVSYLLANRKAVVSELHDETLLEDDIRDALPMARPDQLVRRCIELARDEALRHHYEELGFNAMVARDETAYLRQGLAASELPGRLPIEAQPQPIGLRRGADYWLGKGTARQQAGDLTGARLAYLLVLDHDTRHVGAMANLASLVARMGEAQSAKRTYERALEIDPRLPELWFNYANLLASLGEAEAAERAYGEALSRKPDFAAAHFNLGNLHRDRGRLEEAERCYRRALALQPGLARAHTNLGNLLRRMQRPAEAVASHRAALTLEPQNSEIHFNLGNALLDAGEAAAAVDAYRESLKLRPEQAPVLTNLAAAQRTTGDPTAAEVCLDQALAVAPDYAEAHLARIRPLTAEESTERAGAALDAALARLPEEPRLLRLQGERCFRQRRMEAAVAAYRKAMEREPEHVGTLNALAVALAESGQPQEAIRLWTEALRLAPDDATVHLNLGTQLRLDRAYSQAFAHLRRATELDPQNARSRVSLARALIDVGHAAQARPLLDEALRLDPQYLDARVASAHQHICEARIAVGLAEFDQATTLAADDENAIGAYLFASLYSDAHEAARITALHRKLAGRLCLDTARIDARGAPAPHRPLRLGYISPDFLGHPVGFFMQPILTQHDPARVAVHGYSLRVSPDPFQQRLKDLVPHWRDCARWSDERLRDQIAADGIDVLVDLAGHTAHSRTKLMACRAAPVQAVYLGYPATTGIPAMDYVIGDPWVTPIEAQALFSETIVQLPDCFLCFQAQSDWPPLQAPPSQQRGHLTFGSFNNLPKLCDTTLELWAELMHAVPDSRLALKSLYLADEQTCTDLRERFAARGIEAARLSLLKPSSPLSRYLADYARVDIALDPTPYNGGTTTCDALWMGVPVVSLAGGHFYGRMGASILNAVGLPELVAASPQAYLEIARGLALDPGRLAALRAGMRKRLLQSSLCDGPRFVRHLEDALWLMAERGTDRPPQ